MMETNIHYKVFDYDLSNENTLIGIYPVEEQMQEVAREMVLGGYAVGNVINIEKFLREDLSINLEQLEIATILTAKWLEANVPFDEPLTLHIAGFDMYCKLRGIDDKPRNIAEEYHVIKGIVHAVANNESMKPVKVEYGTDFSVPSAG